MNEEEKRQHLKTLLSNDYSLTLSEAEAALQIAADFEDEDDRSWFRSLLAKKMASAQFWDEALSAARAASNFYNRADALITIAEEMAQAIKWQMAKRLLQEVTSEAVRAEREDAWPWQRAEVLNRAAKLVKRAGDVGTALNIWGEAIRIAQAGQNYDTDVSSVLAEIARELALAGQLETARLVASSIQSPGAREGTLKALESRNQGSDY